MRILPSLALFCALPVLAHSSLKIKTVGNALSPELQQKPAVIHIKSRNCPTCRQMAPIVQQVKDKYKGKVTFITFDVSDGNSAQEAQNVAQKANLSTFFNAHRRETGLTIAIDPRSGRVIDQFFPGSNLDSFSQVLDRAITTMASPSSSKPSRSAYIQRSLL